MFLFKVLNSKILILSFLVSLLTVAIYFPSLENQFVTWDDPEYIYENPHIRVFGTEFIKWAFSAFYFANWHPLTWISYAIDYSIWESDPFGYHLTNVLFHGVNTFLVVVIVFVLWLETLNLSQKKEGNRKFRGYVLASFTGILFGLHPIHVESVAWISERKDVLYAFFFLVSIYLYIQYAKKNRVNHSGSLIGSFTNRYYMLALLTFILSLLSKPMAVTLPAVLIILDFYPLNRISPSSLKHILLEKLPFFLMSAVSSVLTFMAQYSGGAVKSIAGLPLMPRILLAFKSVILYILNMLWPSLLLPFYPSPTDIHSADMISFEYVLYFLFVMALSSVFLYFSVKKTQHVWLAAWGFYLITLLPVLGVIKIGDHYMADRYTYLPSIGPFLIFGIMITWLLEKLARILRKENTYNIACITFAILLSILLSGLAIKQMKIWKNGETFWSKVLENDMSFVPAYLGRGRYYSQVHQWENAIQDFTQAIVLDPMTPKHYYFRGTCYVNTGHYERALSDLTKAIHLGADSSYKLYTNRAIALNGLNRLDEALSDYTKAILLNPNSPEIHYNRGNLHARLGQFDKALADYTQAIRLSRVPHPDYYYNRAVIHKKTGALAEAINDYRQAMRLKKNTAP
ncbi:MAG: tetratricopeptide repeat protein [Nitrospirota bacterium]